MVPVFTSNSHDLYQPVRFREHRPTQTYVLGPENRNRTFSNSVVVASQRENGSYLQILMVFEAPDGFKMFLEMTAAGYLE